MTVTDRPPLTAAEREARYLAQNAGRPLTARQQRRIRRERNEASAPFAEPDADRSSAPL